MSRAIRVSSDQRDVVENCRASDELPPFLREPLIPRAAPRPSPWSDPGVVDKTPIATVLLLEAANVGQLWRMWAEGSALGQNLWSWLSVQAALWLWWNFYRVVTPGAVWARRSAVVGILLNGAVCCTVAWFRWGSR